MRRHGLRRGSTFPMTDLGDGRYVCGEAEVRQAGDGWLASVAGVAIGGGFATREDAWEAISRHWTEQHQQASREERERLQVGR